MEQNAYRNTLGRERDMLALRREKFSERVGARVTRIRAFAASEDEQSKRELFLEFQGLASTARALGYFRVSEIAVRAGEQCSHDVRKRGAASSTELRLLTDSLETELVEIRDAVQIAA